MRKTFTSFLLLLSLGVWAQNISVKSNVLNFPATDEVTPSTKDLMVYNNGSFPVSVVDIDLFKTYGKLAFSVSDTAFMVNPQDSFAVQVSFAPEHNINHELALVIKTETGFGHLAVELTGQGTYSNSYYSSTQNLREEALKTALKARLAQGYTGKSYSVARDNMYATIDNNGGAVECVYTGRTANFNTRSGANSNQFNCEHTFPQGFFNQNQPMRSDIHHLYPTDVSANSRRSNDPFGVVSNPTWTQGGSKSGGGKFEPRDVQKGASARSMMYFVIRYQDYSNHFSGQENILRQWHNDYPPQSAEKTRNDDIYALQNNRNPFVDYPQLEQRISNFVSASTAPSLDKLYYSDDTIFLAQGNGTYTYSFVIYNEGTDPVNISNLATNTAATITSSTSFTINPHEFAVVDLNFDASQSNAGNLTFNQSNAPGQTQTVIIESGTTLSSPEHRKSDLELYPTIAEDHVNIEGWEEVAKLQLSTVSGRRHSEKPAAQIDLSQYEPGLYILQAIMKNGQVYTQKIWLR